MEDIKNKFEKLKAAEQIRLLKLWDDAYYNQDNPLVTDEEYDYCVAYYNTKHPDKKYTSSLGDSSDSFKKFTHQYPVLSLAKITTKEGYDEYGKKFDYNVVVEPKIDGLTVVYYPDGTLVSRGNGHVGEILPNAKFIMGLPKPLDKPVRMEVCIDKDVYVTIPGANKNARNLAAGILRRKTQTEEIKYLTYYAYNILGSDLSEENQLVTLRQNGFKIVDYIKLDSNERYNSYFESLSTLSDTCLAPTDGIVIKSNLPELANSMGMTAHHPNNMVAFKFESQIAETTLTGIEWSMGRTTFTPVAVFNPVILGGSTVQKASLHNLNIINKLGLKIGSKVCVTLKNEIIPQIISCNNSADSICITVPEVCPYCGEKLCINSSEELECQNEECPHLLLNDIERLVSKEAMDINGISEAKAVDIYNYMMSKKMGHFAFNLYNFNVNNIQEALSCSYYSASIFYNAIQKTKINVDPARFLYACNVPNLGLNTAKDIMKFFDYDIQKFLNEFQDKALEINGIGEIIKNSIANRLYYISRCSLMIDSFKAPETINKKSAAKNFVITGTLKEPRKYYENLITEHGHVFQKSITKTTDYLVCGEKAGSKKAKAEKMGITILTEEELINKLKEGDEK